MRNIFSKSFSEIVQHRKNLKSTAHLMAAACDLAYGPHDALTTDAVLLRDKLEGGARLSSKQLADFSGVVHPTRDALARIFLP